ncbi:MAG: glucose-6-phosphate isomerase [Betaproteobacteria bacterium]
MSRLTQSPSWIALESHAEALEDVRLADMFRLDAKRAGRFSLEAAGLFLDYSKQRITAETITHLTALAQHAQLAGWIEKLFSGKTVNDTEKRTAMHPALRGAPGEFSAEYAEKIAATLAQMRGFVDAARSGALRGHSGSPIKTIVNIGIGGSDLGPRLAVRALRGHAAGSPQLRFVANGDPADLAAAIAGLDPASTFFIVSSKTFSTAETLANAHAAKAWLKHAGLESTGHFAAVSANKAGAQAFGIAAERCFPMWDWVGGRYSVWSAIGLPVAIAIGMAGFEAFLAGARDMDRHFRTAPPEANMPALLGMLGVWNVNFFGAGTQAILPYAEDLRDFPAYLQQLEMESNGKHIDRDGKAVDYDTVPVVWGKAGSNGQHAFHQMLHQGTHLVPSDFIVCAQGEENREQHDLLLANALAQSAALAFGEKGAKAYQTCPGNQPSNTLVLPELSPHALGALLALYEHKVFVQSVIWNINPFDQWGVELGKKIAGGLLPAFGGGALPEHTDASTRQLLARLARRKKPL